MPLPALPIYCTSHAARRAKKRCGLNSITVVEKMQVDQAVLFRDGSFRVPVRGPKGRGFAVVVVEEGELVIVTVQPARQHTIRTPF